MKLFIVYVLEVAFNCALSLSAAVAELPSVIPNNPSSDDIASFGIPLVRSTTTINGNVTIQLNDNRQTCCKQQNNTATRPKLPEGYAIISESDEYITAIKFHPTGETWLEASKICYHEGGFLAYATNKGEEDLYLKMMDDYNLNELWIGMHSFFADGYFSTILGEVAKEAAYYTWYPGEPQNGPGEKCTHYWREKGIKGLNDHFCHLNYAFNCKIKLRRN